MLDTERICMNCMNETSGEQVCPVCGFDSASKNPKNCLPIKTVIGERYVIGNAKAVNGEGITYMGYDTVTETAVTIKEYFPLGIAVRNPDNTVSISAGKEYPFNEELLEFIEINKKLGEQNFPALVPVLDVFEENGTAFAVSQHFVSITLRDFLSRNGGTLKWEKVRALFLPLIDTVKGMNDLGIIHKGISPDTILVGRDGRIRISDYAINKLRVANPDFDTQLNDGFAAIEQYGKEFAPVDNSTDVYGFCATLFYVLIGTTVPKATLRLENGSMSIPAKFAEELPRHVLSALANGLQVESKDRTKNMETFKNELVYGEISEGTKQKKPTEKTGGKPKKTEKKKKASSNAKYAVISALSTAAVFLVIFGILSATVFKDAIFGTHEKPTENNSSTEAPVVDKIGTVDKDAVQTAKLYSVPDLKGKTYSEILETEEEYDKFQIVLADKAFSDTYPVGTVCAQSKDPKSQVEKDTVIEITISLGAKEVEIASVKGLDEQSAKLELLKQGFIYNNIEVNEKYDEDAEPGVVLDQEPKAKTKVSRDVKVQIFINTYTSEEKTNSTNSSSKENN